jgi:hypothetical protein
MLAEELQAEVDAYTAAHAAERGEDGRRLVVRNGYHKSREVLTSEGGQSWHQVVCLPGVVTQLDFPDATGGVAVTFQTGFARRRRPAYTDASAGSRRSSGPGRGRAGP